MIPPVGTELNESFATAVTVKVTVVVLSALSESVTVIVADFSPMKVGVPVTVPLEFRVRPVIPVRVPENVALLPRLETSLLLHIVVQL